MSEIKHLIFDLGGVLLNLNYHATTIAFKKNGVNNFQKLYNQKHQINIFNDFEKGFISSQQFLAEIGEITGLNDTQIIGSWNAMLLDLPVERLKFIHSLKNKYQIFLLSNTNEIHIKYFENELDKNNHLTIFKNCFHKIYYSCRMNDRKPESTCFKKVLNENNLMAERTLFIDDSIQHIEVAKKLGINTYLIKQNESIIDLFPDIIQQAHH